MKLGIVCSANHSFGHASVARALARAARRQLQLDRLIIISDQVGLLIRSNFFDDWMEVVPIDAISYLALDIILLDTIPFRRADVLYKILPQIGRTKARIIIGHTGWVPAASPRHLEEWRNLLLFLGSPPVITYHGVDVCTGQCHLAQLAPRLNTLVIHAGLLLPEVQHQKNVPRAKVFSALSGGGYLAADLLNNVKEVLHQMPEHRCVFYAGPYANIRDLPDRVELISGASNIASQLGRYEFSITRAGYSSCCEHIATKIPTLAFPLPNIEQRANVIWSSRYLSLASIFKKGILNVLEPKREDPIAYSWAQILNKVL